MDELEIRKMVKEAVTSAVTETLVQGIAESVVKSVQMSINCAVQDAVDEAMLTYEHRCVLDLDAQQLKSAKRLLDVLESAGHGNPCEGVEEVRANHLFIQSFRRKAEKVGGAFILGVVATLVGVTMAALGYGVKHMMNGGGGS